MPVPVFFADSLKQQLGPSYLPSLSFVSADFPYFTHVGMSQNQVASLNFNPLFIGELIGYSHLLTQPVVLQLEEAWYVFHFQNEFWNVV